MLISSKNRLLHMQITADSIGVYTKVFSLSPYQNFDVIRQWSVQWCLMAGPSCLDKVMPASHYGCKKKLSVPGGGTQIWVGQGFAARASKPLPIFKGDFGRKVYPFLRFFSWNIGPFFKNWAIFRAFAMRKPKNLGSVRKVDPC